MQQKTHFLRLKKGGAMNIPTGYKMTEVGVIPSDWEVLSIFELADKQKSRFDDGDWVEAEHITDKGVRLIQTGNIGVGDYVEKEPKKYINDSSFDRLKCKELRIGDLLICRLAEPAGRACILPNIGDEKVITSVDVTIFRPDEARFDRGYLAQYFSTPQWFDAVLEQVGGTTHKRISRSALGRIQVPLPHLHQQRAIAQVLSDVDALLATLEQLIAKKRDLKQAAMQQLLSGKTRLPGFGGEWEVKPFSAVLNRLNAKSHQIQASEYQEIGRFPVVDQGKDFVVGFSDREDKRFRCPDGGVIVFGDHTCIVKFIDFDFLVGADGTQILHGKHGQNTRFHALQLQYRGIETTGYNRHFKILKEREFFVPPLPEQDAIASALFSMDAELSVLEARRDKTRNLKQAMMQELLTGKTRLV
jgi:type I restriction enzyme, S subunit